MLRPIAGPLGEITTYGASVSATTYAVIEKQLPSRTGPVGPASLEVVHTASVSLVGLLVRINMYVDCRMAGKVFDTTGRLSALAISN